MRALLVLIVAGWLGAEALASRSPAPPFPVMAEARLQKAPSGLKYQDLAKGDGPEAQVGSSVVVDYTLWLADGTLVDSTFKRQKGLQFRIGEGQVIQGFELGVALMTVGSKRLLVIPPKLAYGGQAVGPIPAEATLVMEVELISTTQPRLPPDAMPVVKDSDWKAHPTGMRWTDVKVGDGPVPTRGQTALVEYSGWLANGTLFDSSLLRDEPFKFPAGMGKVIPGWDLAILEMPVGTKRIVSLPPDLAYGPRGSPPAIPPNSTLVFEMELVGVE